MDRTWDPVFRMLNAKKECVSVVKAMLCIMKIVFPLFVMLIQESLVNSQESFVSEDLHVQKECVPVLAVTLQTDKAVFQLRSPHIS